MSSDGGYRSELLNVAVAQLDVAVMVVAVVARVTGEVVVATHVVVVVVVVGVVDVGVVDSVAAVVGVARVVAATKKALAQNAGVVVVALVWGG